MQECECYSLVPKAMNKIIFSNPEVKAIYPTGSFQNLIHNTHNFLFVHLFRNYNNLWPKSKHVLY